MRRSRQDAKPPRGHVLPFSRLFVACHAPRLAGGRAEYQAHAFGIGSAVRSPKSAFLPALRLRNPAVGWTRGIGREGLICLSSVFTTPSVGNARTRLHPSDHVKEVILRKRLDAKLVQQLQQLRPVIHPMQRNMSQHLPAGHCVAKWVIEDHFVAQVRQICAHLRFDQIPN